MAQRKCRVMVIDDDLYTLRQVEKLLSNHFEITKALDGPTGLRLIDTGDIDLVLLDWMMPDVDGIEVLRRLKSKSETEHIPVVFLSAKTDPDSIKYALDQGACAFLPKPFRREELIVFWRISNKTSWVTRKTRLQVFWICTLPCSGVYTMTVR